MSVNCAGVWIPRGVLMCPEIRGHEVLLFAQIVALSANPRGCYAQNQYLSDILQIAKSTVSEYLKALQDKGLIDICRGRDDQGQEERQIWPTAKGAALFAPDATPAPDTPPSAGRSPPFGGAKPPLRPAEAEDKYINNHSARAPTHEGDVRGEVRDEAQTFYRRVMEAAGEAIDLNQNPHMAGIRDLLYLRADIANSPACTDDEIVDAVRFVAAMMVKSHGTGSIKNWNFCRKKAWEYRDSRLNGQAPKVSEKPKGDGLGSPSSFDEVQWRRVINLANFKRVWLTEWGPPPGAEGSHVPAELVNLWKGTAT